MRRTSSFVTFYWLKSDTFNTLNTYCFSIATTVTRTCLKCTFVPAQLAQNFLFSISVHCNSHCNLYWHWRLFVIQLNLYYTHRVSTATNSVKKVSKGNLRNFCHNKGQIVWWSRWQHKIEKLTFAKRLRAPGWNLNGRLETKTVAPQAATTELLVAGLAQWVHFVCNRWQEKSPLCARPITYEKR